MILAVVTAALLAAPGDRWFAPDKVKHFFASAFVQSVAFSAARAMRADTRGALYVASAATAVVGVGKEIHDWRTGGDVSAKDLVWDAAGATAASLVLRRAR